MERDRETELPVGRRQLGDVPRKFGAQLRHVTEACQDVARPFGEVADERFSAYAQGIRGIVEYFLPLGLFVWSIKIGAGRYSTVVGVILGGATGLALVKARDLVSPKHMVSRPPHRLRTWHAHAAGRRFTRVKAKG